MSDGPARAPTLKSTSLTIRGGAPISLTIRPSVIDSYDRARVRAREPNRSAWAENVILAATEGIYTGTAHERLAAAAEAIDLPERSLLRLWLMAAASDDAATQTISQARAYQLARETSEK
jgi:hypothetical protein